MTAITCELCGSNDIQKQDGLYVCQHCGTKYTIEEARKLIGTVSIDNSQQIENLYTLARRAKNNGNIDDAAKYYAQVVTEMPNDWEATFYSVYYASMKCTIAEIENAAYNVRNSIDTTFKLIKNNLPAEQWRVSYIEVFHKVSDLANALWQAASSHMTKFISTDNAIRDFGKRERAIFLLKEHLGDCLIIYFDAKEWASIMYESVYSLALGDTLTHSFSETDLKRMREKVFAINPGFVDEERNILREKAEEEARNAQFERDMAEFDKQMERVEKYGCYIATAVYGSYDCPEVWTLRRYRDNTLSSSWCGRLFVRLYYAVSPTLVRWFGSTNWFKQLWKYPLDRMVKKLNAQGVLNTPYND